MSVKYDAERKTYFCKFSYKDWTGKTRWTTKRGFARRKDAIAYELAAKQSHDAPKQTIRDLAGRWIEDMKQRGLASNSIRAYESIINNHVLPFIGDMVAGEVTVNTMREWQNRQDHNLEHSTRSAWRTAVSMMFNFGVRYCGLPLNPMSSVTMIHARGKHREYNIWEPAEFQRFLDKTPPGSIDRIMYALLYYSGMRIGELLALSPSDFDFTENTISISKTYNRTDKKVGPPKTMSSYRKISMPPQVMQDVRKLLESYSVPPEILKDITAHHTLALNLRVYAAAAGVHRIRIHDIRHSHASLLIRQQIPLTDISRRLGHKNPGITLAVYSRFYESGDAEIAKKLADLEKIGSNLGQEEKKA